MRNDYGNRVKKNMGGGLYENIHKKRARIKAGSGEKMRTPGSKVHQLLKILEILLKLLKKGEHNGWSF